MKKLFLSCFIVLSLPAFSQKTTVPITGISMIKLGDTLTLMSTYNCDFKELLLDSNYNYTDKYRTLENEQTYCSNARVFHAAHFQIDDIEFKDGITLTYYNNKLIEIRLPELLFSDNKLLDIYKTKYGPTFGKVYTSGYQRAIGEYKSRGLAVPPDMKKQFEEDFLFSIYWTYGDNTLAVEHDNKTYDFVEQKYANVDFNEYGIFIRNNVEYQKLIACSNADYTKKSAAYLKKISEKNSKF